MSATTLRTHIARHVRRSGLPRLLFAEATLNLTRYKTCIEARRSYSDEADVPATKRLLRDELAEKLMRKIKNPPPKQELVPLILPRTPKYLQSTTPKMTQAQAEEYLRPLHARGWYVEDLVVEEGEDPQPHLVGELRLKNAIRAQKVVTRIVEIMKAEKHDISWSITLKERPILTMKMNTHSARVYPAVEGQPHTTRPDITMRDVRFAVVTENLMEERGHLWSEFWRRKAKQPWESILKRFPKSQEWVVDEGKQCSEAVEPSHDTPSQPLAGSS